MVWGGFLPKLYGQNEMNTWILGTNGGLSDSTQLDTGDWKLFGNNIINFNTNPFFISRQFKALDLFNNITSICDSTSGQLLFYSNGSKIFNFNHRLMENGDSMNFGVDWREDTSYYSSHRQGFYGESNMIIPHQINKNQYYYLGVKYNYSNILNNIQKPWDKLVYSIIDMSLNGSTGKVIKKEILIDSGNFSSSVSMTRHANGKDWWILVRNYESNCYSKYLLDASGFRKYPNECIGWFLSILKLDSAKYVTSSRFSPDGYKFASYSYKGIELYEFDRCDGKLYNRQETPYPITLNSDTSEAGFGSICFSPNSLFLYATYPIYIYQYETELGKFNISKTTVAKYDGFYWKSNPNDTSNAGWNTLFGNIQIAPDNKIYISSLYQATPYFHVIDNPNQKGYFCNLKQHNLKLLTTNAGLPNYPFYQLKTGACRKSSIESTVIENEILIYPNPVINYLKVNSEQKNLNIEIYNLLGQQVLSEKIIDVVNISYLNRGIYMVQIMDSRGNVMKKERLVIERP
jgi:hypothetical protein